MTQLGLYQNGGHFAVLVFFLISGYLITHMSQLESRREFIIKRFFRIFPPLIISLLFLYIVSLLSVRLNLPLPLGLQESSFRSLAATILLISRPLEIPDFLSVTWTLFIEVVYYIICSIFIKTVDARYRYIKTLTIVLMLSFAGFVFPSATALSNHLCYILFILIGQAIYCFQFNPKQRSEFFALGMTSVFSFILIYNAYYPSKVFTLPGITIVSYLLAVFFFLGALLTIKSVGQFFLFISKISYSLYLYHIPVGSFIAYLLYSLMWWSPTLCVTAGIACSLLISFLANKYIEIPFQKLARRIVVAPKIAWTNSDIRR